MYTYLVRTQMLELAVGYMPIRFAVQPGQLHVILMTMMCSHRRSLQYGRYGSVWSILPQFCGRRRGIRMLCGPCRRLPIHAGSVWMALRSVWDQVDVGSGCQLVVVWLSNKLLVPRPTRPIYPLRPCEHLHFARTTDRLISLKFSTWSHINEGH